MNEHEMITQVGSKAQPAWVLRLPEGDNFSPDFLRVLENIGLTPDEFNDLIHPDLPPLDGPETVPVYDGRGVQIEDMVNHIIQTKPGPAEVAHIRLFPAVVADKDNMSLHLQVGAPGGFEILQAVNGTATLTVPKEVPALAPGVYGASRDRVEIILEPGMIAIVPSPTANGWTKVEPGFEFKYACSPPWDDNFVRPVFDL